MKIKTLEFKVTILFLLTLAIILLISLLVYQHRISSLEISSGVKQSYLVQAEIEKIESFSQRAEISHHHLVITGQSSYLKPYFQAKDSINSCIETLRYLTKEDAHQQIFMTHLKNIIAGKLKYDAEIMELLNQFGKDKALKKMLSADDEKLTDSLKTTLARMEDEEKKLLLKRTFEQDRASDKALFEFKVLVPAFLFAMAIFYMIILNDIKKRKQAEEKLEKLTSELKNKNNLLKESETKLLKLVASKDKLFALVAHDLRGPFSGFLGLSECMANNLDSLKKEEIIEYAQAIYTSSKKIFELLNNLLDWSRLQNGRMEFNPEIINPGKMTNDIVELFKLNAEAKGILITNEIETNEYVFADLKMIATVLRNLISNAIKFTDRGGEIRVSSSITDGQMEIIVTDNGVGMDNDTLDKVFRIDSGYSKKGTAGEEGFGLGLVLCKELIEKNSGEIQLRSFPGKGTEFSFSLPAIETGTFSAEMVR